MTQEIVIQKSAQITTLQEQGSHTNAHLIEIKLNKKRPFSIVQRRVLAENPETLSNGSQLKYFPITRDEFQSILPQIYTSRVAVQGPASGVAKFEMIPIFCFLHSPEVKDQALPTSDEIHCLYPNFELIWERTKDEGIVRKKLEIKLETVVRGGRTRKKFLGSIQCFTKRTRTKTRTRKARRLVLKSRESTVIKTRTRKVTDFISPGQGENIVASGSFSGTVTDGFFQTGLEGAEIYLKDLINQGQFAVSGSEGKYQHGEVALSHFSHDRDSVFASHPFYELSDSIPLQLKFESDTSGHDFVMFPKKVNLQGRLINSRTKEVIKNQKFQLRFQYRYPNSNQIHEIQVSTWSDEEGNYRVNDIYWLFNQIDIESSHALFNSKIDQSLRLDPNLSLNQHDIYLLPNSTTLSGKVVLQSTGKPLGNISIEVNGVQSGVTNELGEYQVELFGDVGKMETIQISAVDGSKRYKVQARVEAFADKGAVDLKTSDFGPGGSLEKKIIRYQQNPRKDFFLKLNTSILDLLPRGIHPKTRKTGLVFIDLSATVQRYKFKDKSGRDLAFDAALRIVDSLASDSETYLVLSPVIYKGNRTFVHDQTLRYSSKALTKQEMHDVLDCLRRKNLRQNLKSAHSCGNFDSRVLARGYWGNTMAFYLKYIANQNRDFDYGFFVGDGEPVVVIEPGDKGYTKEQGDWDLANFQAVIDEEASLLEAFGKPFTFIRIGRSYQDYWDRVPGGQDKVLTPQRLYQILE